MTSAHAERTSRRLHRAAISCLVFGLVIAVVGAAFGRRIAWPLWLLLVANVIEVIAGGMRGRRPWVSDCLAVTGALFSIAAVIALVLLHP